MQDGAIFGRLAAAERRVGWVRGGMRMGARVRREHYFLAFGGRKVLGPLRS